MMAPVQIVIGRGRSHVNNPPLPAEEWGRFQAEVIAELAIHGEYYDTHKGLGIDMNGAPEQNATILGAWPEEFLSRLTDLLQDFKERYDQAVILLIIGELEVI